jgi:hypothetical protein
VAEAHVIVQASLERKGALPEDAVVNTWHFQAEDASVGVTSDDIIGANLDGLLDRLETFYDELATMWSGALTGNLLLKAYDFADTSPRVPIDERPSTFGTLADSMPTEVAICLSMAASITSGQRPGRRRGRVYLGPFGRNLSTYTTGAADGRPDATAINTILDAGENVARGTNPTSFKLAVFSPTEVATGGSTTDAWNVVRKLWVDNAFDIQRRRGARATTREERDLPA